jgi:Ca2+-binding RTX toxin-like protein
MATKRLNEGSFWNSSNEPYAATESWFVDVTDIRRLGASDPAGLLATSVTTGAGNDTISLGDARNTVDSGAGNDVIRGGGFVDTLRGGAGDDFIFGDGDNSSAIVRIGGSLEVTDFGTMVTTEFSGGVSFTNFWGDADFLIGGAGNDTIFGSGGDDRLFGDDENPFSTSVVGNDILHGGTGNDSISGGAGNDLLLGEDGNDLLFGDGGDDDLRGGAGNDMLVGGGGRDMLNGGLGADTFVFSATSVLGTNNSFADHVIGFSAGSGDQIMVKQLTLANFDGQVRLDQGANNWRQLEHIRSVEPALLLRYAHEHAVLGRQRRQPRGRAPCRGSAGWGYLPEREFDFRRRLMLGRPGRPKGLPGCRASGGLHLAARRSEKSGSALAPEALGAIPAGFRHSCRCRQP